MANRRKHPPTRPGPDGSACTSPSATNNGATAQSDRTREIRADGPIRIPALKR